MQKQHTVQADEILGVQTQDVTLAVQKQDTVQDKILGCTMQDEILAVQDKILGCTVQDQILAVQKQHRVQDITCTSHTVCIVQAKVAVQRKQLQDSNLVAFNDCAQILWLQEI